MSVPFCRVGGGQVTLLKYSNVTRYQFVTQKIKFPFKSRSLEPRSHVDTCKQKPGAQSSCLNLGI